MSTGLTSPARSVTIAPTMAVALSAPSPDEGRRSLRTRLKVRTLPGGTLDESSDSATAPATVWSNPLP
jgi:hypothetical protein